MAWYLLAYCIFGYDALKYLQAVVLLLPLTLITQSHNDYLCVLTDKQHTKKNDANK